MTFQSIRNFCLGSFLVVQTVQAQTPVRVDSSPALQEQGTQEQKTGRSFGNGDGSTTEKPSIPDPLLNLLGHKASAHNGRSSDRWLANALEAVTAVRLSKRTLKFLDYGKLAATFLNVQTGKAVRIVALESSRRLADQRHPEIESKYVRQMSVYREATNEELFAVNVVEVQLNEMDAPEHPRSRVICAHCGEGVNDGCEVSGRDGSTLCRACAFGAGYQPHSRPQKEVDREQ